MIDQFINFVIRPPRAEYNPDQYLWEKDFTLAGRKYKREDMELRNERGHALQCSHYVPSSLPDNTPLPCVIYCHGNSGCRADANEVAAVLLPSYITVFTLDFSGSGLSDGDYVSLGWHEKNDLKAVVSYLRGNSMVSCIGLWGRSMGAVTCLLYGAEDPSIAGIVLDSAFSNLFDLMMELVDVYKIRLPKFTVKVGLQYMRRVIVKRAKFDIMRLNCLKAAPKTFIPALFGHAKEDKFIQPHHSDLIFTSYAGDKNIIKFDGDHNSSRPQFYYDSVSIFFYNVLHPPHVPSDLKLNGGTDENLLYEIIASLRNYGADAASSSSAPPSISTAKSTGGLLSDIAPVTTVIETLVIEDDILDGNDPSQLQEKPEKQNEDCCSYTSSNRESWGRCSSLGSDDSPSTDCATATHSNEVTLKVPTTPLQSNKQTTLDPEAEGKTKGSEVTKIPKKSKREKFEKLEALGQRLRLCILKKVNHRKQSST